jgi:hypothetical protein
MSMSFKSKRFTTGLSLIVRLSLPAGALVVATAVPGCMFGSPKPSNVAQGKAYAPGEPTYDQFFGELFRLQLAMGQAPDREAALRARIARAAGLAQESTADEIIANLERSAVRLAKGGVLLRLTVAGLEDDGAPTAKLVTTGVASNPKDAALVGALDQSAKDAAALLAELRSTKPLIERLQDRPAELGPRVDESFQSRSASKRSEVRKNLTDAGQLLPLMGTRSHDLARQLTSFLKKLEKVASTGPTVAPPAPAAPVELEAADPKAKKGAKDAKPKAGGAHPASPGGEAKPTEPKPAGAKPKPPPSDDFEP